MITIREIILALAIAGVILCAYWSYLTRAWPVVIGPASWMVNLAAFRLYWYHEPRDPLFLNSWSSVIHLHGLFLFIGFVGVLIYFYHLEKGE